MCKSIAIWLTNLSLRFLMTQNVNRSIKRIVEEGRDRDEIVDAVVHLAVALKYLEGKGRES